MFAGNLSLNTAASFLLGCALLLGGCAEPSTTAPAESKPTVASWDQDNAVSVLSTQVTTPELVALTDLSDRIRSHKGKLVFVDLWALW